MKLSELRSALHGAALDDVVVAGFVDIDERPLRFHASYRAVFIECGSVLLGFRVLGYTARMELIKTNTLSFPELDDDLEPAWTSIGQVVLKDPYGSNRLRSIHLWGLGEDPNSIECAAARIDLERGQQIFIDPSYLFGIRLGDASQQADWMDNSPEKDHGCCELELGPPTNG